MQGRSSSRVAFDSLMAGGSAQELRARIKEMPAGERRNFLCTSCCMYDRVQSISPKRARVLDEVLASGCSFYRAGAEVCTLTEHPGCPVVPPTACCRLIGMF
ncbi:MAG: hypothetical protein DMG59_06930 [Acidobacteria bacterium]|nr:MAG: hypothetical protein DMG59_06930 [Acidobacteriota bacterium]